MQCAVYNLILSAYSPERLQAYRQEGDVDNISLFGRYLWNTALSESLYPVVQNFEILLRNSIHQVLSEHFKTNEWYEAKVNVLEPDEQKAISQAKQNLIKKKRPLEPGRIVAELSFGFWVRLFYSKYEQKLWPKLLKKVFPFLPAEERTRKKLYARLNRLRNLRNRIFHHEPIWLWTDLEEQHQDMLNLIAAMNVAFFLMIEPVDRFPEVLQSKAEYEKKFKDFYQRQILKICPEFPDCKFLGAT